MVWVLAGRDGLMGGITRELEGTLKEGGQASRDERIPFSWGRGGGYLTSTLH